MSDAVETARAAAQRRKRSIFATGMSSGIARAASFAVTLVAVPLVIRELGPEQYGVYVSLAALVNILLAVDLGLGNALVHEIASLGRSDEDRRRMATLVSSAVLPMLVLVVVAGGVLLLSTQVFNAAALLNTPSDLSQQDVNRLLVLAFIPYLLSLPFGVVARIRYGLQEGHLSHLLQTLGYCIQLALIALAAVLGAGLAWFVVLLGAGALIGHLLDSLVMLARRPWIAPRPSGFEWVHARRLIGSGGLFLMLGLSAAIGYQTDAVVIAHYLGSTDTAIYGVTFQLVAICPVLLSLFLMPVWPAYSEALALREGAWVRAAFRRSLLISVPIGVLAALILAAFGPALVALWAGEEVRPPRGLVLAGAAFIVVNALSGPVAMLLNGLHRLKPQVLVATIMAAANLALSIAWVQNIGLAGPLLATAVTQALIVLLPLAFVIRHMFRSGIVPPG